MSPAAARVMRNSQRARWATYVASLSPSSWWRVNEASGNFTDAIAAITGTAVGGITYHAAGALLGDTDFGITYDGTSGYFTAGDNYDFPALAPFSAVIWIKANTGGTDVARLFDKFTSNNGWRLNYSESTRTLEFDRGNGTAMDAATKSASIVNGVWCLAGATYDGTTMTAWVNGVAGTGVASSKSLPGNAVNLAVGSARGSASTFVDGSVDEPMIFSRALSAGEMQALYTIGRSV